MADAVCGEIMTKEVAVSFPGDTVMRAAELMARHHVGAIPVVDGEQTRALRGILTDRDIVVRLIARGGDPCNTKVDEVMTRDLVTCRPEQSVHDAIDVMADRQVRRMPVVEGGRLVGMIAQADIASRELDRRKTAQMLEEISQPEPKR